MPNFPIERGNTSVLHRCVPSRRHLSAARNNSNRKSTKRATTQSRLAQKNSSATNPWRQCWGKWRLQD